MAIRMMPSMVQHPRTKPVRFGKADPPGSSSPSEPAPFETHVVKNQTPQWVGNLYENDPALKEALNRGGAGWTEEHVRRFGERLGSEEVQEWAFQANAHPPVLKLLDRTGVRINEAEFHPAYHNLMKLAQESRMHAFSWHEKKPGAHVARAAMMYLLSQAESGVCCPTTMTHAGISVLLQHPEIPPVWLEKLTAAEYDPRQLPISRKKGATMGMGMTEKQGGSDVRANETTATPVGNRGKGEKYLLRGHKWFLSAPMSDCWLTLAQTEKGVSCFLVPRRLENGELNRFHLMRLKDKLGNKSNASSEIDYRDTEAYLVGEEGRGVATIMQMVNLTRLDCVMGSAGMMRQALSQAVHHAGHRSVFGKKLVDQPLMRNVLADLAVETEAATVLGMRLAKAFDVAPANKEEADFARLATAVSKYWVCKRAEAVTAEAMEALGGNGYVEESNTARLYREAPVNSIWEGSGNVICLDVLRALRREPETLNAFMKEVKKGAGRNLRFDRLTGRLEADLADLARLSKENPQAVQLEARRIVERMALALQGSLLLRYAPREVSDAFCARMESDYQGFGTLPRDTDFKAILTRANPSQTRGPIPFTA